MIWSSQRVHSDDGSWTLVYESDFDGVYPMEWIYNGFRAEPPTPIRDELERKAFSYYHERRSGADSYGDDDENV